MRRYYASQLLKWRYGERPARLRQLSAKDLAKFVNSRASEMSPASAHTLVVGLRSFLRFLEFSGRIRLRLSDAVPHLAPVPAHQPPKALEWQQWQRFLNQFPRATAMGRRDYAIALCLSQLALRSHEVAALTLDDLNWRARTLRLARTKQRRGRRLPMPDRLAKALVSYLQADQLKRHNLHHFDSWAATFGEPVTAMELSPDGAGYRLNTRFARFINVPKLMQMFRQSADVQTAAMLNLPRPKLEGEKPTIRNAPATPELKAFVQELAARADRLKTSRVDPSEDNMLKITSEGRKAALDLRLMEPATPDEPQGKVNLAVENIHRAQLVFCDLSTPKDKGFSVYRDMADKLERLGVPTREIAFIQDYESDASKLALFRDVRAGKVRVLFGSTQKMGSGTNVQERLIALHHLDAPWWPADVEQREGRILRQGNKNSTVQVYRYVTEGSFDAYMWQTLETKAKFIAQVMSGDMTIRRLKDLDSAALTYAEVKAIASGNPLVIEKAQVDAELIRLTRLRSAHAEEQYRIRANVRRSLEDAGTFTARLGNLRQDIADRQDTSCDKFTIGLDGQTLNNRGIAGELIVRRAEKIKSRVGDDVRIGRFAGFDLFLRPGLNNAVEVILRGKNCYGSRVTDTALGTIRSLEATVQGFEERAARLENDIADAHKRARELETKVGAPFEHEERYQGLCRRQSEIEEKLDLTRNQAPSQIDAISGEDNEPKNCETQDVARIIRTKRHTGMTV
jgi:hypothetical protein